MSICYILGTYPYFSTTFIDREIRMLRRYGVRIRLLAMRRPEAQSSLSPEQRLLQEEITYVLPVKRLAFVAGNMHFLLTRTVAYIGTLAYLVTRRQLRPRDRLMTVLHFAEGVHAAHLLRRESIDQLHAHFLDRAATVAMVASRLLGIPYSLAVHAGGDVFVHPVLLPEKLARAKLVVSCTRYNLHYLKQRLSRPELDGKSVCIHHGLDAGLYAPSSNAHRPPLLLSVARLVESKGIEYLIRACRLLDDRGVDFVCRIVGPGPDYQRLDCLVDALGLRDTVKLCGGLPHDQVRALYDQATVFALPCVRGADGSLDGIPNVLLEAMAAQLPVVSTGIAAIPELLEDGVNGLLVPPRDELALAEALSRLLDDPNLRSDLGRQGHQTVCERFDLERNVRALCDVLVNRGRVEHVVQ